MQWRLPLVLISTLALPISAAAQPCPAAKNLPQLVIDNVREPFVPVTDEWQVFWGDVPLSDTQLILLSGEDRLLERTTQEMQQRGKWVYVGMVTAAVGTALSSVGWVLFGKNEQPLGLTLPIALGGLGIGMGGVLMVTESIQTPLEPHLAPTPVHRLSRQEVRRLVSQVNQRLYREICDAVEETRGSGP